MSAPTLRADTLARDGHPLARLRGETWRRFRAHRLGVAGLAFIGLVALGALSAPALTAAGALADPLQQNLLNMSAGPSLAHPLGTDALGRDLLARTLYGARISLSIGLLVQAVVVVIGGAVGLVAGYLGGHVDNLLMRFTDAMFAFPDLLFVLVMAAVLGPGYWNMVIAIGAINWVFLARLVRGQVLSIKEEDYIAAARAAGARRLKTLSRHVAPHTVAPVIVSVTFSIPSTIFAVAFLSFVGVGMRPPTPSWGVMINEGYQAIFAYPHVVLVPAVALSLTVLSFHFIGDGLRDALDPRARGTGR